MHEKVAPAVTKETIIKTLHEESIPTIEKEIHQAHYHTSIQPIQDRDERPAQHEHRVEEVQRKEFRHGDDDAVRELLAQEAAQFQDSREEGETQYTHEEAQPVVNEHIHHHFYGEFPGQRARVSVSSNEEYNRGDTASHPKGGHHPHCGP